MITIKEEVKIGEVVLEPGDKIQVLKEDAKDLGYFIVEAVEFYQEEEGNNSNIDIQIMHGAMTHDTVLTAKMHNKEYQIVIS